MNNILSIVAYNFLPLLNKIFHALAIEISWPWLKEFVLPNFHFHIIIAQYTAWSVWKQSQNENLMVASLEGMADEAAFPIQVFESWLCSYWYCVNGHSSCEECHFTYSVFVEWLHWVGAVVACRSLNWVFDCTQAVHNELYFPSSTIHSWSFKDEGLILLAKLLVC